MPKSNQKFLQKNIVTELPLAKTRAGYEFDPNKDAWVILDGVSKISVNFQMEFEYSNEFKIAWKKVCIFYFYKYSPRHAGNMHARMVALLKSLFKSHRWSGEEINSVHLASYYSVPSVKEKGYLSSLAGYLKTWGLLEYFGVSDSSIKFLTSIRLQGNKKGEAVLTMDPIKGPLTLIEQESLINALGEAYGNKKISTREYLLVWLFSALGMRPIQYASLKVMDFKKILKNGETTYLLSLPRAKQQGTVNSRSLLKDRSIVTEVGALLEIYIEQLKEDFAIKVEDLGGVPLFPLKGKSVGEQLVEFEFHSSSQQLSNELEGVCLSLKTFSERTGMPIEVGHRRLRRTVGTRAAEEGFGVMVIAELLDHSDTQNAGVYVESTPAIAQRIDRAVAMHLAPLAHAFSGKIISDESRATRGGDKRSRIVDLRIDQSGLAMGSCGQHSFCGFSAPIACYTCSCFEPWLDGPHEAVLHHLIEKRDRLLETTDERIASINDRTILAVAEVVQLCAQMKTKKLGS